MNLWEQEAPAPKRRRRGVKLAVAAAVAMAAIVPSTVYAIHNFDDVPNTNTFHNQISWLAGTGITSGCAKTPGTNFCPGDPVSRGQMAAFLQKHYNVFAGLTATAHGANGGDNGGVIDTWIDAGISATVTIPPGTTGRLIATSTNEVLCNSGDNTVVIIIVFRPSCKLRLVRGASTVMNPAEFVATQSLDAQNTGDTVIDMETVTIVANSGTTPLGPGTYTVKLQLMADDLDSNTDDKLVADIGDYHLRVDAVLVDAA